MNRMNQDLLDPTEVDQFGLATAALLQHGSQSLPVGIQDRLHAARMKALSVQKVEKIYVQQPVCIAEWQQDSRINDIAELDIALLTDDVPPDAYADSGFLGFLKNGHLAESEQDSLDAPKSNTPS
ncbi:MAG: hypothetical protein B7Y55_13640 [Polynucleobacter sp. 35-46-207]|nr:MAG: hypothetical protein B7Y55_13640 [Polynucleobacter sp. 35-46-207]